MKNILNWDEFINEGKTTKSELNILDDLKSNFKSWEYDCDNLEDTEKLARDLQGKLEEKLDPEAEIRNRGDVVFDDKSPKVLDQKDHFPDNSVTQARNAIACVNQYSRVPKWYDGTLTELKEKVIKKIHKLYPSIEIAALEEDED
jgi:hypothetical protein